MSNPSMRPGGALGSNVTDVKSVRLYCTGTGSAKDPVALNLADTTHGTGSSYKSYEKTDNPQACCGVALEAWTAAGFVTVAVKGDVPLVPCESAVATYDFLVGSDDTDARLIDADSGASKIVDAAGTSEANIETAIATALTLANPLAIALTAASSNTCTARLLDPHGLAVD